MILFLDGLALFCVLALAAVGYRRGLIEEAGRLTGLILATVIGLRCYLPVGRLVLARTGWDDRIVLVLSFAALFLLVLLSVRLLTRLVQIMLLTSVTRPGDRLAGLIFGAAKALFILLLAAQITALFPGEGWAQTIRSQSRIYPVLERSGNRALRLFHLERRLPRDAESLRQWLKPNEEGAD